MSVEIRPVATGEREVELAGSFECRRCGECCRPRGYVTVEGDEVVRMAAQVGVPIVEFTRVYTRLSPGRDGLHLVEKSDGSCIFLSEAGECIVHAVKPRQCRDFPVRWNYRGFETFCRGMRKE